MEHKDDIRKGYLLMAVSAFFFAAMGVMVKATRTIPIFERVFFRNLVMLAVVVIFLLRSNESFTGKKSSRPVLVLRSILGFAGVALYFYTISNIQLADAVTLNKLSPFFVVIAAAIFLKERITAFHTLSLFLVFGGVLLIVRPGFNPNMVPAIAGVASAVVAGLAYVCVRHLGKSEHPFTIIFYFCSISTVLSFPLMVYDFVMPGRMEILLLLAIGVFASGGQLFLTLSFKYGQASKVSIISYFSVIFALILGFMIFIEVPDLLSSLGMMVVIGAASLMYVKDGRAKRAEK